MADEWDAWVARHARLFALSSDEDAKRLSAWAGLFKRAGYLPAELVEATEWLVTHAPPERRPQHLPALLARLRERRQRELGARPADDAPLGTCADCGGAGMVCVPNPKALARGSWGTCAVACRCASGRRFREGQKPLQSLDDYEAGRPGWRREWRAHYELLRAEADAEGDLPEALAKVFARLRERAAHLRAAAVPPPAEGGCEIPW